MDQASVWLAKRLMNITQVSPAQYVLLSLNIAETCHNVSTMSMANNVLCGLNGDFRYNVRAVWASQPGFVKLGIQVEDVLGISCYRSSHE